MAGEKEKGATLLRESCLCRPPGESCLCRPPGESCLCILPIEEDADAPVVAAKKAKNAFNNFFPPPLCSPSNSGASFIFSSNSSNDTWVYCPINSETFASLTLFSGFSFIIFNNSSFIFFCCIVAPSTINLKSLEYALSCKLSGEVGSFPIVNISPLVCKLSNIF